MRKIVIAILILVAILFSGCAYNKNGSRMSVIYNDGFCIIYQDNETGVQYFSRGNCGTCVMVDKDGKPYYGKETE